MLEILKEGGSHNSLFRTYLHAKMLLCDLLILCNERDLAMKRPLMDPHNPIPIKNERHRRTYLLANLLKTFSHRDMLTEINRPSHQISRAYNLCHFSKCFFLVPCSKARPQRRGRSNATEGGFFDSPTCLAISDPLQDWLMISKKQYPAGHFGCAECYLSKR